MHTVGVWVFLYKQWEQRTPTENQLAQGLFSPIIKVKLNHIWPTSPSVTFPVKLIKQYAVSIIWQKRHVFVDLVSIRLLYSGPIPRWLAGYSCRCRALEYPVWAVSRDYIVVGLFILVKSSLYNGFGIGSISCK